MGKVAKHVEGRSKEARMANRKALGSLSSLTVQPKTKVRYEQARKKFYIFLHDSHLVLPTQRDALDGLLCDYLEFLWASGEGRGLASDTVAGLQDHDPRLRGHLLGSWRLLKAWHLNEIPNRAPPFGENVLQAMVGWAWFKEEYLFGLSLLLGFYGLLRTGEIYDLTTTSVGMSSASSVAVISLGLTKGGKRTGASESVTIHVSEVLRRLWQWCSAQNPTTKLVPSIHRWRELFRQCLVALEIDTFGFRGYSLRRGGATFWFGKHSSFDKLLVQGRWMSAKTARVYLNEGLALLADLKLPQTHLRTFHRIYVNALSQPLPKLELSSKGGRAGGRGKKPQKTRVKSWMAVEEPSVAETHLW